jgi:hypothetical protein
MIKEPVLRWKPTTKATTNAMSARESPPRASEASLRCEPRLRPGGADEAGPRWRDKYSAIPPGGADEAIRLRRMSYADFSRGVRLGCSRGTSVG